MTPPKQRSALLSTLNAEPKHASFANFAIPSTELRPSLRFLVADHATHVLFCHILLRVQLAHPPFQVSQAVGRCFGTCPCTS